MSSFKFRTEKRFKTSQTWTAWRRALTRSLAFGWAHWISHRSLAKACFLACQKIDMNGLNFTCHHSTFSRFIFYSTLFYHYFQVERTAIASCTSVCVSFLFAVLSVVPPQSWTFLCNYYFTFAPMTQAICLYSLNALRSPVQCIQAVLFQFHAVIRI